MLSHLNTECRRLRRYTRRLEIRMGYLYQLAWAQITQSDRKSTSVQDNRRACDNISRYSADIVWHAGKKLTVIAVNPDHSLRCSIG